MGFLDAKERILDVVLTNRGRELLAQNLLDFTYYAFSDDGIDYGAALTASLTQLSASVDTHIRRQPLFEADQYTDSYKNTDLKYFLYTIPSGRVTLPEFKTNFDDTPSLSTKRSYYVDKLILSAKSGGVKKIDEPMAVVARGVIDKQVFGKEKQKEYVDLQKYKQSLENREVGKSVVGQAAYYKHVFLDDETVLNTETNEVQSFDDFSKITGSMTLLSVNEEVEFVKSISRSKINFLLKSSEGEVSPSSGYLIEVYESGSDGKITKVVEKTVVDALGGEPQKGFESDLFFVADVEEQTLIDEELRIQQQQDREREVALARLQKKLLKQIEALK